MRHWLFIVNIIKLIFMTYLSLSSFLVKYKLYKSNKLKNILEFILDLEMLEIYLASYKNCHKY